MTNWNPNSGMLGPEFLASRESSQTLSRSRGFVQRFRSTSTETIGAVRLHGAWSIGATRARYIAEITAQGNEEWTTSPVENSFAPSGISDINGDVRTMQNGYFTHTVIAEWPPYVGANQDGLMLGTSTNGWAAWFTANFATSNFTATGRIVSVALELVTPYGTSEEWLVPQTPPYRSFVVALVDGAGGQYGGIWKDVPNNNFANTEGRAWYSWGEINPITAEPWTQQDIRNLAGSNRIRVRRSQPAPGDGHAILSAVRLVVICEPSERRLARAVFTTPTTVVPGSQGWTDANTLKSPAGATSWSKASGTYYSLVVRQADEAEQHAGGTGTNPYPFTVALVGATTGEQPPPDLSGLTLPVASGQTYDEAIALPWLRNGTPVATANYLMPFVLMGSGGGTSADGQPYVGIREVSVAATLGSSEQELTPSLSGSYSGLRVMLGVSVDSDNVPLVPQDDLTVEVRQRSSGALVRTFTVTPESAPTGGLAMVEAKATPFNLSGGTEYFLSFTSVSLDPWKVGLLRVQQTATGGGTLYEEPTFGGGTSRADEVQGISYPSAVGTPADFMALLDVHVSAPSGFSATPSSLAFAATGTGCRIDAIPVVVVAWTPTAESLFARYVIQRLAPDGVTWESIASITDQDVEGFSDAEVRIGVTETYRMRVELTDRRISGWSATDTALTSVVSSGLTFTSNEAIDLSVAYADVYDSAQPKRTYEFPDAEEVTFVALYGRDDVVAFRSPADRHIRFTRDVLVSSLDAPAVGAGPPAAEALRELSRAPVSYVCVRDEIGNRFFGSVAVQSLSVRRSETHVAQIQFVTTTTIPSTPDSIVC